MSGTCGRRAPGVVPRAQARNQARDMRAGAERNGRPRAIRAKIWVHSGGVRRTQHEKAAGAGAAIAADRGAS